MAAHMIGGHSRREREGGKGAQNSVLPYLDFAYLAPAPFSLFSSQGVERPPHPPGPQVADREMATGQDKTRQYLFASYTTWYIDCFPNNLKLQSSILGILG